MAELARLQPSFLGATSVAVKPPRQDGITTFQSDAQNEGLRCLRKDTAALDGKIDESISPLQLQTVNEETLSELRRSGSLASFRTASTELYVPLQSTDESPQNACVSNFKNDVQYARQASLLQKVDDFTREKMKGPESSKRDGKKRKRSHTELSTLDVEAAIACVVSAAEAVVVGHLMDVSTLSFGQDRSIIVEAALCLGKARRAWGLDKYDLSASTEDYDNLAMQDLDDQIMQEAYADVGMIVDVLEDQTQILGVGTEVVNSFQLNTEVDAAVAFARGSPADTSDCLPNNGQTTSESWKEPAQNYKSVDQPPNSFDIEAGSIVGQPTEFGRHVCQGHDRNGDNAQAHSFGAQELKEATGNFQLAERASTIEINGPAKIDGLYLGNEVEEPSPSCKSIATVSSDPEVEIAEIVPGNQEINVGGCQQEIEVLQEMDSAVMESKAVGVSRIEVIQCQREVEAPDLLLSTSSLRLEGDCSQLGLELVTECVNLPTETAKSMEEVSSRPEEYT